MLSRVLIFNLKLFFSLYQEQPSLIWVWKNKIFFYRDSSASSIRGGSSYTRRKWEEDVKKNSLNEGPTSLNTSYQRRCGIFSCLFFIKKGLQIKRNELITESLCKDSLKLNGHMLKCCSEWLQSTYLCWCNACADFKATPFLLA